MRNLQPWEQIVAKKRSLRDQKIEPYIVADVDQRIPRVYNVHERTCLHDASGFEEITDIDSAPQLLEQLKTGRITAEQTTLAYIKRAVVAHQLTNCITEVIFEEALVQARNLDCEFQRTGKVKGPLHGIPVTLKDQFNIKGVDSTLGYVGRSFAPAAQDAILVRLLKSMGAVVLAKTNLPQSIMWAETENPLWGLTTNPRDPALTPGGSTGGEAALLALRGSLLGFGTDIGGSIRIPQSLMGLYGLKPSVRPDSEAIAKMILTPHQSSRLPYHGVPVSTEGQEHVPSSVGPMARDLSSLCYVSRALIDAKPWLFDPKCPPLPWNENAFREIQSRPMTIGLIVDDGVVRVHPPIARALRELSTALKAHGHEIVTWDASDHLECIRLMDSFYTVDGGEDVRRDVGAAGEPYIPHVEALVNRGKAVSVYEYWQLNKRKVALQKQYLDKWNATLSPSGKPVDILLAPTTPHPAIPHRGIRWVGYTKIWNFLDYPAVTFPVDRVRADQDELPADYQPRNELDAWNWNLYDARAMDGHPVNLQVIGRKLEEEVVLGAASAIETLWKKACVIGEGA